MAYDKAVDSAQLDAGLTTIADAIRAKGGTTEPLDFPNGMADAVAAISGGGTPTNGPRYIDEAMYVQAEEWPNSSKGNTLNFAQTYCHLGEIESNHLYIAIIKENDKPGNYGRMLFAYNRPDFVQGVKNASQGVGIRGASPQPTVIGLGFDFFVMRGAKIRVLHYSMEDAV